MSSDGTGKGPRRVRGKPSHTHGYVGFPFRSECNVVKKMRLALVFIVFRMGTAVAESIEIGWYLETSSHWGIFTKVKMSIL